MLVPSTKDLHVSKTMCQPWAHSDMLYINTLQAFFAHSQLLDAPHYESALTDGDHRYRKNWDRQLFLEYICQLCIFRLFLLFWPWSKTIKSGIDINWILLFVCVCEKKSRLSLDFFLPIRDRIQLGWIVDGWKTISVSGFWLVPPKRAQVSGPTWPCLGQVSSCQS